MPGFQQLLQHVGIALRLSSAHPSVAGEDASLHAQAAVAASTERVKPELLLAIAFVESRYDPLSVSRVEGHKRRVGHYPSREPPARWRKGTSLYCGPLQTHAATWADCLAQRDLHVAYAAGAREIEEWLNHKRVRGDVARALAGYGCGNRGVRTGKCSHGYQHRVLAYARRIAAGAALPRV